MPPCSASPLLHSGWKHGPSVPVGLLPLGSEFARGAVLPPLKRDTGRGSGGGMDAGRREESLNPSWTNLTLAAKQFWRSAVTLSPSIIQSVKWSQWLQMGSRGDLWALMIFQMLCKETQDLFVIGDVKSSHSTSGLGRAHQDKLFWANQV